MTALQKNILLFHSHGKVKNSGGGTYTNLLIDILSSSPEVALTIVYTDCEEVAEVSHEYIQQIEVLKIPQPGNNIYISYKNNVHQEIYCQRILNILYPIINPKKNLIIWFNHPDDMNLAALIKKSWGCYIVFVVHSWPWKEMVNTTDASFYAGLQQANEIDLAQEFAISQVNFCHLADKVVTVTAYSKNILINVFGFLEEKCLTIYNGIKSTSDNTLERENILREFCFEQSDIILLYVGRLHDNKGVNALISAVKLILPDRPNVRLVLAGTGSIDQYIKLSSPFFGRITFTGTLDQDALFKLYSISQVGIIPSLFEQCSFTSIEMRKFKLPLVVSATEGLDEMFKDGFDCLKVPLETTVSGERYINAELLSEKIGKLIDNIKLSKELSENSFITGNKLFTYTKMRDQYIAFLKSIDWKTT